MPSARSGASPKKDWDFIATLGYEFGLNNSTSSSSFGSFDSTSSGSFSTSRSSSTTRQITNLDYKGVTGSLYFQHSANGLSSRDNVFFSINGGYFFRKTNLDYLEESKTVKASTGSPTTEGFIQTTVVQSDEPTSYSIQWALGYVSRPQLEDISLLIGVQTSGSYRQSEEYGIVRRQISTIAGQFISVPLPKQSFSSWFVGANLPIYANYAISEWCRVFGSLVYTVSYSKSEQTNEPLPFTRTEATSPNPPTTLNSANGSIKVSGENLSSSQIFSLGADLRHKSGINLQILFGGDLAAYQAWNVSHGYLF